MIPIQIAISPPACNSCFWVQNYSSSSSMTQFDGSRHGMRPISRSPPINSGLRSSNRSPIKILSQSPPKMSIPWQGCVPTKVLAQSPPRAGLLLTREKAAPPRSVSQDISAGSAKASLASRRKKAFNPFRQSDEDEVLAKRSHNRRRWSHVFPAGEVEFKRHAGPIWNSLTSPAILPLSVDYFPSPQELKDENVFQFSFYQVTLGGKENNPYATHADLLMEMVRQRVTQDFQIVTSLAIAESERRAAESQREGKIPTKRHQSLTLTRKCTFLSCQSFSSLLCCSSQYRKVSINKTPRICREKNPSFDQT